MKLKLIAAAVLAMAGVGAQADTATINWASHAPAEVGVRLPTGSFIDYYLFTINPAANATSSAVALNNTSIFNITGGTYSLWSDGGDGVGGNADTQISASFSFDGTSGNTFNSVLLQTGSYFYKVTGEATGQFGGFYSLTSTLAAAPVPEPETYALMLAGLGAVAFVARRRKSV